MAEKGMYYFLLAMSKRLGINIETFRTLLNGQPRICSFELEMIAAEKKVKVEFQLEPQYSLVQVLRLGNYS